MKQTSGSTIAREMRIDANEISERKAFLDLTTDDAVAARRACQSGAG